jgi:hypothetical protein
MDEGGIDMDVQELRRLKPKLTNYLKRFAHCFPRKDAPARLPVYVIGQLSDLPRNSADLSHSRKE